MSDVTVRLRPETRRTLACLECARSTVHDVLASADRSGQTEEDDIRWWAQYEIVQCRGCEGVSFRKDHQHTEDTYHTRDGQEHLTPHEELFPPRVPGRQLLPDAYLLPSTVRTVYEETHQALTNGQRLLCGIGIRALVESVCHEKGAKGRNLEKRIDSLVDLGVLTAEGAEILHGTRLLGNEAAHEQTPLSADLLNAGMEVAEHLVRSVYILPKIADSLPKRSKPGGSDAK